MRGLRESRFFQEALLRQMNLPKNAAKGHWRRMPRWKIWLKIFEESMEVLCAYLALCWSEGQMGRRDDAVTVVNYFNARRNLREEIADLSVCLLILADNCGALREDEEPCG